MGNHDVVFVVFKAYFELKSVKKKYIGLACETITVVIITSIAMAQEAKMMTERNLIVCA